MKELAYWAIGLALATIGISSTLFYQAEALMAATPEEREKTSRSAKRAAYYCIGFAMLYLSSGVFILFCM